MKTNVFYCCLMLFPWFPRLSPPIPSKVRLKIPWKRDLVRNLVKLILKFWNFKTFKTYFWKFWIQNFQSKMLNLRQSHTLCLLVGQINPRKFDEMLDPGRQVNIILVFVGKCCPGKTFVKQVIKHLLKIWNFPKHNQSSFAWAT